MMIILASASPRRKEILGELGVDFRVIVADTDESSDERDPERLTEELARRKGIAVWEKICAERPDGIDIEDCAVSRLIRWCGSTARYSASRETEPMRSV